MTENSVHGEAARSAAAAPETLQQAGIREWIGLAVLGLPTLLLALDFTMLHLAMPHLASDLQANSIQQLWILDIYGFMIAGFLVTMGSIGDRIGRRKLLLIGSAIFGVISVIAAFSTNAPMLIVMRGLLGISGAALMPSTLALIQSMFQRPEQRSLAVGIWMVCFSAGGVLGPAIGGILLEYYWWGAVFLLGVPVMLLLLVTGPLLLPEYKVSSQENAGEVHPSDSPVAKDTSGKPAIDISSVLMSLAAVLLVVFGLKELSLLGSILPPLLLIGVGGFIGWCFVRRQLHLDSPLVDVRMFRNRSFSISLAMLLLGMMTMGAFVLMFTQYVQLVVGMSPLEAGLWMIPYAVGSIVGIIAAPILVRRIPATVLIVIGIMISCIGYAIVIWFSRGEDLIGPVIGSFVLLLGVGPLQVLTIDLIVGSAPPEKAGSASSLSEMCSELGMAAGVAIFGSIVTIGYRMTVSLPEGMPQTVMEASGSSLAEAAAQSERMPDDIAARLIDAGRDAYLNGMQTAGSIGIVVLLAVALLAWRSRRNVR